MKILIYIKPFYPLLGGLENVVQMLARGFTARGHQVKLVTLTEGSEEQDKEMFPFEVIRNPGIVEYFQLMKWCDVFIQGGLALRGAWPLLFVRRPFVVKHGSWYYHKGTHNSFRESMKHFITALTTINICPSQAIADHILGSKKIIPNPYRDDIFGKCTEETLKGDLIFVGRLVSVKGVDILLKAIALLRDRGEIVFLTVVGSGPEEENLRSLAHELGISASVTFTGLLESGEVARVLCRHKILVVPSVYEEPFGIVALEGIACGCVVVGTKGGGLPEAIGPCGLTVENGNVQALSDALSIVLKDRELCERFRAAAPEHLKRHSQAEVVRSYLEVMEQVAVSHK